MMEIKAYENNIVMSCLHGNKILKKKEKEEIEDKSSYKKQYNLKGEKEIETIGKYFDVYI